MIFYPPVNLVQQSVRTTLKACLFWLDMLALFSLGLSYSGSAQVIGDNTLPNPSQVIQSDKTFIIEGGTSDGTNLFQSFEQFNIHSPNQTILFNHSSNIANIITRVTGGSISVINGKLATQGNANLFLINPRGIIFGPGATLDIGGSFLASTANSIKFAQGGEFSAINPQTPPLLTVNQPIGLELGSEQGSIIVQGNGHQLREIDIRFPRVDQSKSNTGLRVQSGETLALIGNNITLQGSTLTAESGHIEIGAVAEGLVSLNLTASSWNFDYQNVSHFDNVELSQLAALDASGLQGGLIQIYGSSVTVADGSFILSQTEGDLPGANIYINASESLNIIGILPDNSIRTSIINQSVADGQGGRIEVVTSQLLLQKGGIVTTRSLNDGSGGSIKITATDSIEIDGGISSLGQSGFISTVTQGPGDAGDLEIFTRELRLVNGGNLLSAGISRTVSDGKQTLEVVENPGSVGQVTIEATESVQIIGPSTANLLTTSLGSTTFGNGDAGSVLINTRRVEVQQGGRIDVATFSAGDAGSITINASEYLEVSGKAPDFINPSLIISSANILDESTRAFFSLPDVPSGNSGNVTINTPQLRVSDGAQVTVRNDGTGNAGIVTINAGSILLNNQGGITASTASGEGGNIILNVQNLLELHNNSFISATAQGSGNGGNLDINAKFIFAPPIENSDITADAIAGRGGNINISTEGLFGIIPRDQSTSLSDISASSELGISGVVQVNRPDYEPQDQLSQNPTQPNAPQFTEGCQGGTAQTASRFVIIGRGGISSNPTEPLSNNNIWEDLQPPQSSDETQSTTSAQIIEAQGWIIDSQGKVLLVSQDPKIITKLKCETQDLPF